MSGLGYTHTYRVHKSLQCLKGRFKRGRCLTTQLEELLLLSFTGRKYFRIFRQQLQLVDQQPSVRHYAIACLVETDRVALKASEPLCEMLVMQRGSRSVKLREIGCNAAPTHTTALSYMRGSKVHAVGSCSMHLTVETPKRSDPDPGPFWLSGLW